MICVSVFDTEVLVIARKALLVLLNIAFMWDRRLQGMLCMLLIIVSTFFHVNRMPYLNKTLNQLELVSLCVTRLEAWLWSCFVCLKPTILM